MNRTNERIKTNTQMTNSKRPMALQMALAPNKNV